MSGLQILAPLGLIALAGIPLIIYFHMRHTTPVERPVPALRFWQQIAPAPTDDARLRRPPLSLLLLLQLLAVGTLGLAMARPAVTDAWAGLTRQTGPVHLIVLLDGSTSMQALDTESGQTRFEVAKSLALQRIGALHEGDVATVLLLGASVHSFEAADSAGLQSLTNRLKTLSLPGGRTDLSAALALAGNLILPDLDDRVLVITDGAVAADPAVVARLGAPIELAQIGRASAPNLAVVQLTAGIDKGRTALFARLANFSGNDIDIPVSILADGLEIESRRVSIPAGKIVDFVSDALPADIARVRLELRASDVFPADDSAELALSRDSDLTQRILLVSDTPLILQRALDALPSAQITTISSADYRSGLVDGGPFDLTVFEEYVPAETSDLTTPALFVHPPVVGLLPATGVMTSATVQHTRSGDPLLTGVDLTGLNFGETPVHSLGPDDTEVVAGENGPLIYRGTAPGSDEPMVVFSFGVQESVLPQRIAFPILIANSVRELAPAVLPASAVLGDPLILQPRGGATTFRITAPDGVVTDIPVTAGADGAAGPVIYPETGQAGEYTVQELDQSDRAVASGTIVIAAGHPTESNLTANPDLPDVLATAGAAAAEHSTPRQPGDLWPILAGLALGLLTVEWFWAVMGSGTRRQICPPKRVRA